MNDAKEAVILVGHGGVPRDYPRERLRRLRELESAREAAGAEEMGEEEARLDRDVREWPRTPETDPYQAGLEALGRELAPLLGETRLAVAYNEFCSPSIEETVCRLADSGIVRMTLLSSMFTPGGSHSEKDIPAVLGRLSRFYPDLRIEYAWPYDLGRMARMLSEHLYQWEEEKSCSR